jgi:glycine/D-amino acid oxidase-like deaminating enzyme
MQAAIAHASVPLLASVDVLVAGAGSAGCCAAIAAARQGRGNLSVMLIERYGFLGGASTGVLDTFYGFFTPGPQPRKVVGGLPDEVVDSLAAQGAMYLRPNT